MGFYLNPDNMQFRTALNGKIYVDKTHLISYLNSLINTPNKYLAVSRPRRFGKSITVNMISSYYCLTADSRSLFEGRKLSEFCNWDQYLGKFNVIRITMTELIKEDIPVRKSLERLSMRLLKDLSKVYPDVEYDPDECILSR